MKAERTYGSSKNEPKELATFNVVMRYLGNYNDNLPDFLAIGTAMFSKMGEKKRREPVKDRFKIELDDNELERLNKMTTLGKDKFEYGMAVGTEKGIRIGTVSTAADAIIALMGTGMTMEEALFRFPLQDQYREDVCAEVRRRLSQ